MNCWSPTSTASRRRWKSASGISRPSRTPASSRSSTGPSPSRRTAIRWSGRCAACRASGSACGVMAGFQPGRRRRAGAVQLDDRGRSRRRHLGHGCRALRRLGDDGLHQRQGARELFAALFDPLPQRGTAGRTSAQDDAGLRPAVGQGRAVGRRPTGWKCRSGMRRRASRTSSRGGARAISTHVANEVEGGARTASACRRSRTSPNTR